MPLITTRASAAYGAGFAAITTAPYVLTGAFDSLGVTTVGAGGLSSVTFTGIPTGYKHLQVRGSWKGNRATYPVSGTNLQFNGDTGNNYASHEIQGGGASATSGGTASTNTLGLGQPGTSVTNFAACILDIFDYGSNTKYKTIRALAGLDVNGTVAGYGGSVALESGLWMNTSPITSMTIAPSDGSSWQQYSSFALYGVK